MHQCQQSRSPYLTLTLKKHLPREQLRQDASQTPNINLLSVFTPQDDFRCAITASLNVELWKIMEEDAGANVNDLDLAVAVRLDEYVFRLEVAVDDVQSMQCGQRSCDLPGNTL